jgi:ABC-type amino acid transport substrate-binding protein
VKKLHGAPLLVALVVGLGLVPAAVRADSSPPTPPPATAAPPPRSLVVGLSLGDPRLQAGVVRGRDVILARGFEVELARVLARRLGGRVDGFVYVPSAPRLLASSLAGWQLALGGIVPAGSTGAAGDASSPYLTTDVAVIARRGLERPHGLADLRGSILCAIRGSEAAHVLAARVRPRRAPLLVPGADRLRTLLRTGACDAGLVPAIEAGVFLDGQRRLFGPVVARIPNRGGYVMLLRRGEGLDVAVVDRELARLARDGTLGRLAKAWLGLDPAALPILR